MTSKTKNEAHQNGPFRILVADDELSIRLGCKRVLSEEGFEVITVEDGVEAVEAFSQSTFDLVLLDLAMPRKEGLEVIPELLVMDPIAVIVIITGYASFETAVKAIQSGAYDYVPKPFTPAELKIVVKRALEKRTFLKETERLRRQQELSLKDLAFEKSRTKAILDNLNDSLFVVNSDDQLVLLNRSAKRFFKDTDSLIGSDFKDTIILETVKSGVEETISEIRQTLGARSAEIEDNETKHCFIMNSTAILDADGNYQGCSILLYDISHIKELEKAKSKFVSIVAHELKAPCAAIEGYIDLILSDGDEPLTQGQTSKLERCRNRAINLQQLIRELLDLARIEQKKTDRNISRINPVKTVTENSEFFTPQAMERNITINMVENEDNIEICCDPNELNQIVTNLITNAIKYNRENGEIRISSEKTDNFWCLKIRDTGIGISLKDQERIGEDFFRVKNATTTKISGTGLGLSIVKRLLDLNHAVLKIESEVNVGSEFTILWPLA
ncbi:MAG: hypothetical protein CVV64_03910 [Candidatus Wallbacteria bacterium HGW-Wallbacteria-1]|jgi:signal transduction histidine kinase|uniref:histidine kinase n=1 Tax=Candidatus Wallbacteria bacterium HGW-Wallbacteria-1 TaxID=2013854 RepID=A0A2N1PRF5_9BACT|nr:MAG: hypothetical protein CVV64_03910 [Candidatus Wallbacteria bacterium HGW-Wallbacteria-1]